MSKMSAGSKAWQTLASEGFKPGNGLAKKELECLQLIRCHALLGLKCTYRSLMADLDYKSSRSSQILLDALLSKGLISKLDYTAYDVQIKPLNKPLTNHLHIITVSIPILIGHDSPFRFEADHPCIPVADNLIDLTKQYFMFPANGVFLLTEKGATPDVNDLVIARINDSYHAVSWVPAQGAIVLKGSQNYVVQPDFKPIGVVREIIQG